MSETDQPLAGKSIVITRAPEQAQELTHSLENMGARVLLLPTVFFAPPEDWRDLDEELRKLEEFDAILFLSQNAVRYLFKRCRDLGIKCETIPSKTMIAAVGPATAQAITNEGARVDYVAKNHTGAALAEELRDSLKGRSIFVPRSDRGDARLSEALRESGARVTEAIAYRTMAPESLDPAILSQIRGAKVDAIVFASPSAFHNLSDFIATPELAELSRRISFGAIGPTTAHALRDAGVRVAIESNESSSEGLADSIAKYFQRQPLSMRRQ